MARKRSQEEANITGDLSVFERDGATIAYSRPTAQGVIEHPAIKWRRVISFEEDHQHVGVAITKRYDSFDDVFEEHLAAERRDQGAEQVEISTPSEPDQKGQSAQVLVNLPYATKEFLRASEDSESGSEGEVQSPSPSQIADLADAHQNR